MERMACCSIIVAVTLAFGTGSPLGSLTNPAMSPVAICATAGTVMPGTSALRHANRILAGITLRNTVSLLSELTIFATKYADSLRKYINYVYRRYQQMSILYITACRSNDVDMIIVSPTT